MLRRGYLQNGLIGTLAALFGGALLVHPPEQPGPAMRIVTSVVSGGPATASPTASATSASISDKVGNALKAFSPVSSSLSSPAALEDGFRSYSPTRQPIPAT